MEDTLFCRSSLLVLCSAYIYLLYFAFQKYQISPSTTYELSNGTVLQCVLATSTLENKKLDSALYQNVALHTDLLPNIYEG